MPEFFQQAVAQDFKDEAMRLQTPSIWTLMDIYVGQRKLCQR